MKTARLTFDLLLALLVLSAALGFWVAHDRGAFLPRFLMLAAGAALAFGVNHLRSRRHLSIALVLFVLCGVGLSLRFMLFNDWATPIWLDRQVKLPVIGRLIALMPALMPAGARFEIEPDTAGGIAAITVPFLVLLLLNAPRRATRIAWTVSLIILVIALAVSLSYGAWLAAAASLTAWALWRWSARWLQRRGVSAPRSWRMQVSALAVATLLFVIAYAALVLLAQARSLPVIDVIAARAADWLPALPLARDYFWTGIGMGSFPAQYPVYALLTNFIVVPRARNVWLDVQVQQGVLGLIALAGLCAVAVIAGLRALRNAAPQDSKMIEAGLAATAALLINGTLNDPLYGSAPAGLGLLLVCLPPAFVISASRLCQSPDEARPAAARRNSIVFAAAIGVLVIVFGVLWRPAWGSLQANLGAVAQSQAELRAYDPNQFDRPTLDEVRQTVDLAAAEAHFSDALASNPANLTARLRLAQIAMSLGRYDEALDQAEAAWQAGHRDALTRMTLSDALVARGRVDEAAKLVAGIEQAEARLSYQGWYRYWHAEDYPRAIQAYRAALLLDPQDEDVKRYIAEAETLVKRKP